MSEILSISKFFVFLIIIIGPLLGLWVYFANPKEKINKLFSLTASLAVVWAVFVYLAFTAKDEGVALFWSKLSVMTVMSLLISLYFLAVYFPRESKRPGILDKIIILFGIIFLFLGAFTNLIVNSVIKLEGWGFSPILGKLGFILNGGALFITSFGLYFIFRKYVKLSQVERIKIQYFLIGLFIFILTNIIFNVFWPIYLGEYRFAQIGTNSAIFLLGLTAYAIVARELFGIRVILTQALVGVIAVLLLWQAIIAPPDWIGFSWKFALFLLLLVFGYFLIQSVIREIQRRVELQRLNAELRRLYEEVDRLSRAKSEFISIASHQLRTPLTAIKGYISMLIEGTYGKMEGKSVKPMGRVYESNERLIKLVNDLLNVSRIESGTLRIDLEKTSLENIVSSVVDELKIKANEKNLSLSWQRPERPLPKVTVDQDKFRQVVLNIIDNCIKYTEKGGVTVGAELKNPTAKWPKGSVLIKIKDTGEGMTKEELEKMFESFSRGKAGEKHWSAGTGLGLYIAKKFTEIHGGKVRAESEGEGKGSTFYVELPVK